MPEFRGWPVILLSILCLLLFSPFLALWTGLRHLLKFDLYGLNGFACVGCLCLTPITLIFYSIIGVLIF